MSGRWARTPRIYHLASSKHDRVTAVLRGDMFAEMLDFDDAGDFHEFCIGFADRIQNEISEIVFVSRLDGEARNLPWRV